MALQAILAATAFKCLLFGAYHSTDFEVHRNWLAITYSVNISEWYTESTSKWTLDYPPFFAYFEFILAQIGSKIDPKMVVISKKPYSSSATVFFQRSTVLISEFLFLYSISKLLSVIFGPPDEKKRSLYLTAISLFAFNFGLFVVDRILFLHFQFIISSRMYHGLLFFNSTFFLKIFIFSITVFSLVSCFYQYSKLFKVKWNHLFALAAIVCSVFAVSLGPFVLLGKLPDLMARLFPFDRGLCHAYWAPNFWALYNIADKVLNTSGLFSSFCSKELQKSLDNQVSMTRGLTGNYRHLCLPTVRPLHTTLLTIASVVPGLIICTTRNVFLMDSGFILVRAIISAAWASFLFGWHVHEKAVLVITLPLTLLAVVSRRIRGLSFYVTSIAHFSLLPLIFTLDEQPVVLSSYVLYTLVQYLFLGRSSIPVTGGILAQYWPLLTILGEIHLLGLVPLLLITRVLLPLLYPRLEFLPLMLTSVYCAVGLLVAFFIYTWINLSWMRDEKLAREEEMGDAYYKAKSSFFKKND